MGLRKPAVQDGLREVVTRDPNRDLPGLLRQLRTGNPQERRWAARDLVEYPEATSALGDHLARETETQVREAIFTTLGALSSAQAVQALLPMLRSEDAQLRNGAIEALTEMPEAVGPCVVALLDDADPDVRIFTVNLLGDLKHPDINIWLTKVLTRDEHVNVVAAAIEVVAEVGTPEAVPALQAAVLRFSSDPFLGFAADMAIERIESV